MKPYYEKDGIAIYHGDCREYMNECPGVDLVLTDPPYGIPHGNATWEKRKVGRQDGGELSRRGDYGNYDVGAITDALLGQVISMGQSHIVFGGNYYSLPPSSCWLVWDKDNGANDFADCELAWTDLKKAVRKFKYRWQGMLQEHGGRNKETRWHPTQKPVELMKWCILQAPESVKTILDPFMGSGSTLVAAKELGRQATGIEREEQYCEAAVKRLAQGTLFSHGT